MTSCDAPGERGGCDAQYLDALSKRTIDNVVNTTMSKIEGSEISGMFTSSQQIRKLEDYHHRLFHTLLCHIQYCHTHTTFSHTTDPIQQIHTNTTLSHTAMSYTQHHTQLSQTTLCRTQRRMQLSRQTSVTCNSVTHKIVTSNCPHVPVAGMAFTAMGWRGSTPHFGQVMSDTDTCHLHQLILINCTWDFDRLEVSHTFPI